MKTRNQIIVAAMCMGGLLAGWASAQIPAVPSPMVPVIPVQPPVVVSGEDVGFRIEGRRGDVQVGTLVVRIGGRWVATQAPAIGRIVN